jgi:hypothetical protein
MREKLIELLYEVQDYGAKNTCGVYSVTVESKSNEKIADQLIANGVTIQKWIPVSERLPEENKYVLIWCGEIQVARIEKGISEEERASMKRGELPDPEIMGWTLVDGWSGAKRSRCYFSCDIQGNNKVPYCWKPNGGPMQWFGQDVTYWMPLPEPPKEG